MGGAAVSLAVALTARAGTFTLTADVAAEAGSVVALVGPNGAGKSTLLRAIAGVHPSHGPIAIDGADVAGLATHARRVGYVPQDGALFPHLTALDNVAFGPRQLGVRRTAARRRAAEWLDRLGVGELAHRRPAALSGGQAQRVALARALAVDPRVLLLDEPLAALDADARTDVRQALRRHLSAYDGTTLVVTHDPLDAVTLADRLVVLDEGRVVQDASPVEVTRAPRSPWVARLLGANAYRATSAADGLRLDEGGTLVGADDIAPGVPLLAVVPPHAVALHRQRPEGSPRNLWPGTVSELTLVGARVRVGVDGRPPNVAEVTAAAAAELELREGAPVWVSIKATEVTLVAL
jgi:molybdate transport system permease protein